VAKPARWSGCEWFRGIPAWVILHIREAVTKEQRGDGVYPLRCVLSAHYSRIGFDRGPYKLVCLVTIGPNRLKVAGELSVPSAIASTEPVDHIPDQLGLGREFPLCFWLLPMLLFIARPS
jgi:hypothetical protein